MPVTTTQTFLDLITRSMRFAGILAAGEAPSAEDADDVALIANAMLDAWGMDNLFVYNQTIATYALTSNQQSYPIGPSAAAPFNVSRPSRLQNANLAITSQSPTVEMPLEVLDDNGWMSIPVKNITGTYPTKVYLSSDFPNATLFFWPIPTSGLSVVLDVWNQLSQFAAFADVFTFPPGYYEAIYQNIGLRLCTPEWGLNEVPQSIFRLANESRMRIQSLNTNPPPQLGQDYPGGVRETQGYRNLYNPAPIWTR